MRLKGLGASEKLALKCCCKHQISANSVNSLPPSPPYMWTFSSHLMIFHQLYNFTDTKDHYWGVQLHY